NPVQHPDTRALLDKTRHHGPADTGTAAGHQRYLAIEPTHREVLLSDADRCRISPAREAYNISGLRNTDSPFSAVYCPSQALSKRQPLKRLLVITVIPCTCG